MSKTTDFITYLESKVGNIYVWGAQGKDLTNMTEAQVISYIKSRESTQANRDRALALYRKVKASGKSPIEAYDCSGLIVHYICDIKHWIKNDTTANGLYNLCKSRGKIAGAKLNKGDLVFIHKGAKKTHVGVYVGNGYTIEAYGRDLGVVKRKLSQGEWTHWGSLSALQETADKWTVSRLLKLTSPMQRGEDVKELQSRIIDAGFKAVLVNGELKTVKADGIFGEITAAAVKAYQKSNGLKADGKAGKNTITALGGVWRG